MPEFEFNYEGENKSVTIRIGEDEDLYIVDILEAVRDILISGGFDYVDEVRAINYGDRENKIFTSNRDDEEWIEPIDVPPPDDLERIMAEETIRIANGEIPDDIEKRREFAMDIIESEKNTKSGLSENEVNYVDEKSF